MLITVEGPVFDVLSTRAPAPSLVDDLARCGWERTSAGDGINVWIRRRPSVPAQEASR